MRALLERIDDAWLKVEAMLCVAFLAVMSVLVFLDVVHRVAATPEGRLARILKNAFGGSPGADGAIEGFVAPAITAVFWLVVLYGAVRTAKREVPVSKRKAAAIAAGATLGLWLVVQAYVALLPNGLVWAQPVALAMMLWTGFLGASIATKVGAHVVLEIMEFAIPKALKPVAAGFGNAFAAIFCAFLSWISFLFMHSYYEEWAETGGIAGTIEGVPLPKFIVYAILPFAFGVMAARFSARAAIGFSGREPPKPEDERPRDAAPAPAPAEEGA